MKKIPFKATEILLPETEKMSNWSVVACDQYTSEPEYWNRVKTTVADSPSTFNLILPEIYLEDDDSEQKI